MQKRFCCLAVIATVLSIAPISLADASLIAPKAAIQADYDHIYYDVRHKNLTRAARYFAADFTGEDAVTPPQQSNAANEFSAVTPSRCRLQWGESEHYGPCGHPEICHSWRPRHGDGGASRFCRDAS